MPQTYDSNPTRHGREKIQTNRRGSSEAATAFTVESKNILGTESCMGSGSLSRKESGIQAEEMLYAKGQPVKDPFYGNPDPFTIRAGQDFTFPPKLELQSCKWSSYPAVPFHTHLPHLP